MLWSKQQEKAIDAEKGNYLISAGAGSGKTAVLTERVYQLIKKDYKISRFLVLTFTEAASAEMKIRIRDKLLSDPELTNLASEIENSHIETFDAFAGFLVRKYSHKLGIDSHFQNLDGTIANLKRRSFINELFDEYYENNDPLFVEMIKKFCSKDDISIRDYVFSLGEISSKLINPESLFNDCQNTFFSDEYLNKRIEQEFERRRYVLNRIIDNAYKLEDVDDCDAIIEFANKALSCSTYDELQAFVDDKIIGFPDKDRKTQTTDKPFRDSIADLYKKEIKKKNYGSSGTIKTLQLSTKKYVDLIVEMTKKVEKRLRDYQKTVNAFSFSEIARMASTLLKDKEVVNEVSNIFDFIMVDEYQDTNDIQEEVIQTISRNNVYMVGDMKQAIYRFRDANPLIFQNKYNSYKDGVLGTKIDMNTSYRTREEVVNAINEIFDVLMDKQTNPIDYKNGHHFESGFDAYKIKKDNKEDYNFKIYTYPSVDSQTDLKEEVNIVIDDIIYKINNKYQVYDRKMEKLRDCTFKDFAIIIDRKTDFDEFRRAFSEKAIPLKAIYNERIGKTDVSLVIQNLLKLFYYTLKEDFDNEYIHAFVSVARSFLMRMSDKDIYLWVKNKIFQHSEVHYKITRVVNEYKNKSLFEILSALFDEFELYYKIRTIRHFEDNVYKANSFLDLAKKMDELGLSISEMIEYFADLQENELDIEVVSKEASENSVTIINIHKSKGLEYSFVYFPCLYKHFNRSSINTSFLTSKNFGVLFPIDKVENINSLFNHLLKEEESQQDVEEKLRLLYVALTRVKERAILLCPIKENETKKLLLSKSLSFKDFIEYGDFISKYGVEYKYKNEQLLEKTPQNTDKKIEIREISVPSTMIEKKRASKENEGEVDESLLEFGSELHYLLEVVDYETKDTSFIKDNGLKKYVSNVLNSEPFKGVKNKQINHEYEFYDENSGVNGIIDALIVHDDYIDIVDFKLKNIADDKYVEQLHTYRDYVKTISDKPIKMHLIAAITGEVKEIE